MDKPADAFKTFSWIGSHKTPKKTASSKANLERARERRKVLQEQGLKIGGWPKGKKRKGGTHDGGASNEK